MTRLAVVTAVVLFAGAGVALAQDAAVDVRDNTFSPASVTVEPGDTVEWTQSGNNPHSITADDGSFDSHPNCPPACSGNGDSFSHTFDEPGTYRYYCKVHGGEGGTGMSGRVVVRAADEPREEPAPDAHRDTPPELPRSGVASSPAVGVGLLSLAALLRYWTTRRPTIPMPRWILQKKS